MRGERMDTVLRYVVCPIAVIAIAGYFSGALLRPIFYLSIYRTALGVFVGLFACAACYELGIDRAIYAYQTFVIDHKVHTALAKNDTDTAEQALIASEEGMDAMSAARVPTWVFLGIACLSIASEIFGMIAKWHVREQGRHEPKKEQK
jgi:hypothetical protein